MHLIGGSDKVNKCILKKYNYYDGSVIKKRKAEENHCLAVFKPTILGSRGECSTVATVLLDKSKNFDFVLSNVS